MHEIAHQWFGDAVTCRVAGHLAQRGLRDLLGVDLRREARRRRPPQQAFDDASTPAGDELVLATRRRPRRRAGVHVHIAVYDRGAMTLQALRGKIGDGASSRSCATWYAENRNGNVTTADFIALAERVSGQQLDAFFDVWLLPAGAADHLVARADRGAARAAPRRRARGCERRQDAWRPLAASCSVSGRLQHRAQFRSHGCVRA